MKVLLTGASSGIGKAMAKAFAKRGFELLLCGRNEEALKSLSEELSVPSKTYLYDLSKKEEVISLFEATKGENVDILVNNAGFGKVGDFLSYPVETDLEMTAVNEIAPLLLTKLFLPLFIEKKEGLILNVSSSAAFMPAGPYFASYYATKTYLYSLTRAIEKEIRGSGVTLSLLCPGPVKTAFDKRAGVKDSLSGLESDYVGEYAVKKLLKKKKVIVPSLKIKLLPVLAKLLPQRALIALTAKQQKKKLK